MFHMNLVQIADFDCHGCQGDTKLLKCSKIFSETIREIKLILYFVYMLMALAST